MAELFASGRIVDFILALLAIEGVALTLFHRRTGRGIAPGNLLGFLFSGLFLLLALRAALVGAWWGWISLSLAAALLAHLIDLKQRWKNAD